MIENLIKYLKFTITDYNSFRWTKPIPTSLDPPDSGGSAARLSTKVSSSRWYLTRQKTISPQQSRLRPILHPPKQIPA